MENVIEIIDILEQGEISIEGEFLWGSNYTFLATVEFAEDSVQAVYKPIRGERPLWDFPPASLARREVAAFLFSEAIGWKFVPPTVYRADGPLGSGSLQLYIEHDPEYHYFNFSLEDRQRLRPVVLFDYLINNADRKGSHVILGPDNRIWLIDHGLCFHIQDKLRTVIWDFAGESIPDILCSNINQLWKLLQQEGDSNSQLALDLNKHISREEIQAISHRAIRLISENIFIAPDQNRRHFPWPQI